MAHHGHENVSDEELRRAVDEWSADAQATPEVPRSTRTRTAHGRSLQEALLTATSLTSRSTDLGFPRSESPRGSATPPADGHGAVGNFASSTAPWMDIPDDWSLWMDSRSLRTTTVIPLVGEDELNADADDFLAQMHTDPRYSDFLGEDYATMGLEVVAATQYAASPNTHARPPRDASAAAASPNTHAPTPTEASTAVEAA